MKIASNKCFIVSNSCTLITTHFLLLLIIMYCSADSSQIGFRFRNKCFECSTHSLSNPVVGEELSRNAIQTKTVTSWHDLVSSKVSKPTRSLLITTQRTSFKKMLKTRLINEAKLNYLVKNITRIRRMKSKNDVQNALASLDAVEGVTSRSPQDRQLQPLDPEFGAFYIQRKLWYVPLYFSIVFCLYMWSLIIKSLSRHRVLYPPPAPLPPPGVVIGR